MMNLFLWVVVLPFCMWVWWGIAFVTARTLIAIVTFVVTEELDMKTKTKDHKYDRLIRYAAVAHEAKPNLLSTYDAEKNLQIIDFDLVTRLPASMVDRLEMSVIPETMIIDDGMGLRFGEWKHLGVNH